MNPHLIEFAVSVLRPTDRGKGSRHVMDTLRVNATEVKLRGVWLFEGAWDTLLDEGIDVTCLGEIVVPALGGMPQVRLAKLVDARIKIEPEVKR